MRRIASTLLVLVAGALIPAAGTSGVPALAAAATTTSGAAAAAGPTAGSIGVRLLDVSADEKNNPRARVYIIDFLPLGSVIHRHIDVTNYSSSPRRVVLYPGAAAIKNGTFNVAAGRTRNDLTTWIKLSPAAVTLQPHASARVTVTIAVPRDAYPGERYAGIWAQTADASRHGKKAIVEVNRVGIRVYLAVGKGGAPAPNFVITSLTAQRQLNGHPAVAAQVRNTGGRALDLSGELTLADGPGGLSAGPFPARLGTTIAPGQSEPVTIVLNKQVPDGPWKALIRLTSGLTSRSARATITFPRGVGSSRAQSTLAASGHYVIGGGAAALILLAALLTIRRRSRRPVAARAGAHRS
jgi:hypothetical protein